MPGTAAIGSRLGVESESARLRPCRAGARWWTALAPPATPMAAAGVGVVAVMGVGAGKCGGSSQPAMGAVVNTTALRAARPV